MAPQVASSSPVHHQHTTPSIAQTMVPSLHRLHRLGAFLISMPCRTLRALQLRHHAPVQTFHQTHILVPIQIIYMPEAPAAAQAAGTPERVISLDRIPCAVCAHRTCRCDAVSLPSSTDYQDMELRMEIAGRTRAAAK
jgi:hypothetical protein